MFLRVHVVRRGRGLADLGSHVVCHVRIRVGGRHAMGGDARVAMEEMLLFYKRLATKAAHHLVTMDSLTNELLGSSTSAKLIRSSGYGVQNSFLTFPSQYLRFSTHHGRTSPPRCHTTSPNSSQHRPPHNIIDRRQLLLASTLSLASSLPSSPPSMASPVQFPNLKQCTTSIAPGNGAPSVNCCLPVSTSITDFQFPTSLPMRFRQSAHLVNAEYIAKYNKAYQLLRELPSDDPRQFNQQANAHCAFCDAAYDENGTSTEYQVHNSWLFFPWHRWYLYFHERILATLIKDDTFALPFWNWDAAAGYTLPPMYKDSTSSLYDSNRNPAHQSSIVDLNYNFTESGLSASAQLAANNTLMYRQLVTNAKTPSLFFGQAYRQGDAASPGGGTVENTPHGTVHVWTGNPNNPNDEDMGTLYSAGRDPIFFAHHSNIDRLWEVWKSLGGRRKDLTSTDWLDAAFLFYDENAQLVRVTIKDALDTTKLAYKYQQVPNPWIKAVPKAKSSSTSAALNFGPGGAPGPAMAGIKQKIKEELREFKERESKKLDNIITALVKRPKKVKAEDFEEEILLIEGVEIPTEEKVKFDVYINLPDADEKAGSETSEYAGSFFNVPHLGMKMGEGKRVRKSNFRLGIGEVLKELGVEDDDSFSVTIVPRSKNRIPISIKDVKLEYE